MFSDVKQIFAKARGETYQPPRGPGRPPEYGISNLGSKRIFAYRAPDWKPNGV